MEEPQRRDEDDMVMMIITGTDTKQNLMMTSVGDVSYSECDPELIRQRGVPGLLTSSHHQTADSSAERVKRRALNESNMRE